MHFKSHLFIRNVKKFFSHYILIKNSPQKNLRGVFNFFSRILNSALNFTRTKATCTNIHAFNFTVDNSADVLNIRFPFAFRLQMRMANVHSRHNTFMTNFTIASHSFHLPSKQWANYNTENFFVQIFFSVSRRIIFIYVFIVIFKWLV